MSERIQSVVKGSGGEITDYVLSNGETVSKQQGVEMAQRGEIDGVIVSHSKKGDGYLRTKGDGVEGNNLSEMSSKK